jgi:hypothetical protein
MSLGSSQILEVLVPLTKLEPTNYHAVPLSSLASLQHSFASDVVDRGITLLAVSVRVRP